MISQLGKFAIADIFVFAHSLFLTYDERFSEVTVCVSQAQIIDNSLLSNKQYVDVCMLMYHYNYW